jgi:hypothetical protein
MPKIFDPGSSRESVEQLGTLGQQANRRIPDRTAVVRQAVTIG